VSEQFRRQVTQLESNIGSRKNPRTAKQQDKNQITSLHLAWRPLYAGCVYRPRLPLRSSQHPFRHLNRKGITDICDIPLPGRSRGLVDLVFSERKAHWSGMDRCAISLTEVRLISTNAPCWQSDSVGFSAKKNSFLRADHSTYLLFHSEISAALRWPRKGQGGCRWRSRAGCTRAVPPAAPESRKAVADAEAPPWPGSSPWPRGPKGAPRRT
jgi:hypothetical protein